VSPLLNGTTVVNDVAILFSHEQLNALTIQPQSDGFDYLANLKQIHRAFIRLGVGTDVINWTSDIHRYKLVVAPFLFLINEDVAKTLTDYVAGGGTLILTCRTGVKNMNNVCLPTQLPGPLSELAGVLVDEYDPVGHDTQFVSLGEDSTFECTQWCDILTPTTAETVGTYASEFFADRAAVTRNRFGNGLTYYLGTVLADDGYKAWFERILIDLSIAVMPHLPAGVEVSVRTDGERRLLFVLNLTKNEQVVELPEGNYQSVLSQLAASRHLVLEAMGVEILQSVGGRT
jgi:beta-galactosidase